MTRRKRLTSSQVISLPIRPKRYFHSDPELNGFFVRVAPTGAKAYVAVARAPSGKQVWTTIGGTDLYSEIEIAREEAREIIKRIKRGETPREKPLQQPNSFRSIAESWIRRHVDENELRSKPEIERILTKYLFPKWAERPFTEIRRDDASTLMDKISVDHGKYQANAVLAVLCSIAGWYAEEKDERYISPFHGRRLRRKTKARDRFLSDDEIRVVWKQAGYCGTYGNFVRLLLLTGQRREKVQHIRWSDISTDGTWTIPRDHERQKGTGELLKLPPLALQVIETQPKIDGNAFVFASDRTSGPIVGLGRCQNQFRDNCALEQEWRLHDLRRTARTIMSRIKIEPHVAERVLGHTVGSTVARTYDRFEYFEPKAHALAALAAEIERIIKPTRGPKVVPIHARKRAVA